MNASLTQSIHIAKVAINSNNIYALERALKAVEYYMCAIYSNEYLNSKYSLVMTNKKLSCQSYLGLKL